jgi:hypothetical protein
MREQSVGLAQKRKLAHQLWQLRPELKRVFEKRFEALKLPSQYFAMHIRRGDKGPEAPLVPIDTFVKALEKDIPPNASPHVFVASDDSKAVADLHSARYTWHCMPGEWTGVLICILVGPHGTSTPSQGNSGMYACFWASR